MKVNNLDAAVGKKKKMCRGMQILPVVKVVDSKNKLYSSFLNSRDVSKDTFRKDLIRDVDIRNAK